MYDRLKRRLVNSRLFDNARRMTGRGGQQNDSQWFRDHIIRSIRKYAPERTFADIGCMWGINGEFCFLAEEAGARSVAGVDVMYPTEVFTVRQSSTSSRVKFIQGDFHDSAVQREIGVRNVVLCSGVFYHVPNPIETFLSLRKICDEYLILSGAAIPEMGVEHGAVFWPYLKEQQRQLWQRGTGTQFGITTPYIPGEGYGNWIWGLTPSAVTAMLRMAGFAVISRNVIPFGLVFVCRTKEVEFAPIGGSEEMMNHWSAPTGTT